MKEKLQLPIFKIIKTLAGEENSHVYVIGGYVRDLMNIDFLEY